MASFQQGNSNGNVKTDEEEKQPGTSQAVTEEDKIELAIKQRIEELDKLMDEEECLKLFIERKKLTFPQMVFKMVDYTGPYNQEFIDEEIKRKLASDLKEKYPYLDHDKLTIKVERQI